MQKECLLKKTLVTEETVLVRPDVIATLAQPLDRGSSGLTFDVSSAASSSCEEAACTQANRPERIIPCCGSHKARNATGNQTARSQGSVITPSSAIAGRRLSSQGMVQSTGCVCHTFLARVYSQPSSIRSEADGSGSVLLPLFEARVGILARPEYWRRRLRRRRVQHVFST